ncbi:MAG: hypothetical protein ACI8P3_003030 [Saprospiraceae bacterium]
MIVPVKPIGTYYKVDKMGLLVNPAHWTHVPTEWHAPIECIKQAYIQHYQKDLHSIYLRGSIVRGTFMKGLSDIDVLGLVYIDNIKWEHSPFEAALFEDLKLTFPFEANFELMVSSFSSDLNTSYPALAMVLKTQSLCIWGNDVLENIPPFRADRSLLIHYKWLDKDIAGFLENNNVEESDYQEIMKLMVRCGFELLIEKSGSYTTDLYPAVQSFGQYYPAYKSAMEKALFYFLNPYENLNQQRELILTLGKWLILEINSRLR